MKQTKTITIYVIACVIAGVGAFYGGMKYGMSKNSAMGKRFQNFSPEERQAGMRQFTNSGQWGTRVGSGMAAGEIISKDDNGITVKLQDGGSKIILFSDSTQIMKSLAGTAEDINVGGNIMVNGSANPDGSITANMIQLRQNTPVQPNIGK
ncbi:MAG: hypothetical protein V1860_03375 [bacterium]